MDCCKSNVNTSESYKQIRDEKCFLNPPYVEQGQLNNLYETSQASLFVCWKQEQINAVTDMICHKNHAVFTLQISMSKLHPNNTVLSHDVQAAR